MLHAWNRILPQYSHLIQKNKKTAFSFCIAAFVAIILDFIFEITLFGSSLVISGKFYKVPKYSPEKKSCRSWSLQYSRFLTKKSTRIGVILLSFGFLLISLYGTLTIETKIDSQRIIPYDSPLRESDKLFKEYYWKEHELIEIFVTSPPNISNPEEFSEFQRMMNEFHDLPRAIGSTSTVLFLDDYIKYKRIRNRYEVVDDADKIKDHLSIRGQTVVDAFKFYTGFHNATTWMERAENMLNWRRVASRWSQFNVTVYSENAAVFEGIFNMASQTSLSATSTLICMIVVCFLFVPSLVGVVMAAFAIASISLESIKNKYYFCLSAWNVQLTSASSTDCLHHTISAVASPMLQAAASTIACFIPVAFHPDCTPTVFIRTIFLVVTFGVLHGLLILPTLLAMLPRRYFVFDVLYCYI
uniref:SSD domain-containing protein n=1 Tax=Heterorhabditis bacteriophora TaxID=37862 RepID=A0A1I7WSX7_HETBA